MQPVSQEIAAQHKAQAEAQANALQLFVATQFLQIVEANDFANTSLEWIDAVTPSIGTYAMRSAERSRLIYNAIRRVEKPGAPRFDVPRLEGLREQAEAAARVALLATGPIALKKSLADANPDMPAVDFSGLQLPGGISDSTFAAAKEKYSNLAGAAGARISHKGGVDQIADATQQDSVAIGWIRQTSDDCCHFCALLATRGFALDKGNTSHYRKDSFDESDARFVGAGSAKVHDHCRCVMVPRFTRDDKDFSDKAEKDYELYLSLPGRESALKEFRRAYEGRAATLKTA